MTRRVVRVARPREKVEDQARGLFGALQRDIARTVVARGPGAVPYKDAEELRNELAAFVSDAVGEERVRPDPEKLEKRIQLFTLNDGLANRVVQQVLGAGVRPRDVSVVLVGSEPQATDFDRSKPDLCFLRSDDARFFARFIVEDTREGLRVLAYSGEVWWSDFNLEKAKDRWFRYDLNLPGTDNEARGMRSHLHMGSDDWSTPAPEFRPLELLTTLILAGPGLKKEE